MLLKDVHELLYKDVDTDNGPSPVINKATDDFVRGGRLNPPDVTVPGIEHNIEIDSHQRVIRRTDANGHATRFDYEGWTAPGRIAFADGTCFDFHFTEAGILEKFLTDDRPLANYKVTTESGSWKVDYADGTRSEFVVESGRITHAVNPSGTVELKYDDNGLLISETFEGRTVTYHRNETGHLIGLTTPFGQIIHYQRDSRNRVCRIKEWAGQDIRVDYAISGAMQSISYPNGTRLCQKSTDDGRPSELRLIAPSADETIFHKIYHRDPLSRITRISSGDNEMIYTYDKEGRLTGAESKHPSNYAAFTVDGKSNRISDHHRQYAINTADRLVKSGDIEFQYDHLGNLIQGTCPRGPARYKYFSLNRLGSFTQGNGRTQYRYDALGRRVAKKVNGVTTRYYWAGNQLLHEVQRRTTGNQKSTGVTDYLFFPGRPALLAIRRNHKTHWAAFGHRYEVLCLTTDDGRPVWQAEYDSFGQAHIEKGSNIFQPLRLAGQYLDDESGLHYHLNRYYDPELGRYLSMTPLFLESGSDNFYTYGKGDPINHVDTDGIAEFSPRLIDTAMASAIGNHTETGPKHPTQTEMDIFTVAKAALLGSVMNTVSNSMNLREEIAPGSTMVDDASASKLTSISASGLLFGKSDSTVERNRQGIKINTPIDPRDKGKTALPSRLSDASKKIRTTEDPITPLEPKSLHPEMIKMQTKRTPTAPKSKTKRVSVSESLQLKDCRLKDDLHQCIEGGHVNALTGEVTVSRTDFILAGRIPMTWSCHYQSRNTYTGLLGRGWQTPADARIEVDDNGSVLFFDGGPTGVLFEVLPTDLPIMAAVNGALLTATQEYYQVRLKSGLTYHFPKKISESLTHVVRISDVYDNFLSFYREDTALTQIWDNSDKYIQITCKGGRISAMKWQDKPLSVYHYDGEYLTAAVDALGHQKSYYYCNGAMVRHMDKNKHSYYFKYDKSGRCIRTWDDNGLYEYQFDYPPDEHLTVVTDSIGHIKTYLYDNHLQTLIEKNHTGAPLSIQYDELGRIIASTDKLNQSTSYQYDKAGNITGVMRADIRLAALSYDNNHRLVKLIDANRNTWEQRFDDHGRITEKIDPLGKRVQYAYNRQGDLADVTEERLTTRFEYDDHGLVSTVTRGKNNPTTYQRDTSGNITAVIDPTGQAARYVYDAKCRLIQAVQPSGISQSFDWDPEDNLLIHTDPNGRQTRFEYGVGNRIIRRRNPDNTCISFEYDTEENLINIINERGQCHHNKYDHAGRITAQTDYFGHTRRFAYDAAGQLIEQVDPYEKVVTHTYDPLGRLITRTFDGDEQALFKWDAAGNLISFQSPEVSVERCYDAAHQLSSEKKGAFSVDYQYDSNGRPTQRTTSHGNRVHYSYDDMGAVAAIQINDQPPVTIERNNRGQIMAEHLSGSLRRSFSYDQDGLLTRQTINAAAVEIERRYSYDGAGNLIAKQDSHKGDWRYSYDAMDRITESLDPQLQTHRLTYDPCGDLVNHLPQVKEGLRCAQQNNTRYHYDAAGNLVQRSDGESEYRFEWDEQNCLKTICKGDKSDITMVYDALGRRHSKSVKGKTTFFYWEDHTLISEQYEDGPAREYVYYPGTLSPLAVIDSDKQIYYYHNDVNGVPLELTRPKGKIVWSVGYDALGSVEQIYVDEVRQPLRLPGQYLDEEIGLCYNGRRYFDPTTCSYICQNALGPSTGENLYAYAPNVWAPVDTAGFCKTLLKKTALRRRHGDIAKACGSSAPVPRPEFRHHCFPGRPSPSTMRTCYSGALMAPVKLRQDAFSITPTSAGHEEHEIGWSAYHRV